jgi:hypothetical protein
LSQYFSFFPKEIELKYFIYYIIGAFAWLFVLDKMNGPLAVNRKRLISKVASGNRLPPEPPNNSKFLAFLINLVPLLLLIALYLLKKHFGDSLGETIIASFVLVCIVGYAFVQHKFPSMIPGICVFIFSFLLKTSWINYMASFGLSLVSDVRFLSLVLCVIGFQFRNKAFWKLFLLFWIIFIGLTLLLGYACQQDSMQIRDFTTNTLHPAPQGSASYYLIFFMFGILVGFPIALRSALSETMHKGFMRNIFFFAVGLLQFFSGILIMMFIFQANGNKDIHPVALFLSTLFFYILLGGDLFTWTDVSDFA